jgi:DNA-directed RNA polymerase subunit RPC12/RpoP
MGKWFCLNCKEEVKTYMDIFKGFALCCKQCGSTRLMKLEDMKEEEFKKLVKDFKKRTGEVE